LCLYHLIRAILFVPSCRHFLIQYHFVLTILSNTIFIPSFILDNSIVPLQGHYYSEALRTQLGNCGGV